jgi:hypothetical protein
MFKAAEATMMREHPAEVDEARALADKLVDPLTASADEIWPVLWDKPLYAYTRVKIADGYVEKLTPFAAGATWRHWGDPERPFVICTGRANLNTSFKITEHAPTGLDALSIARGRIYAVGGAARALQKWSTRSVAPLAPFLAMDSANLLKTMRDDLGLRWGHITIMHFLTDMGLFCKPDRWLVRSAHALGIADGCKRDRDVPTRKEAILIDRAVKQLVRDVYGELTGKRLRYVDKILMDASRLGVLGAGQEG